MEVLLHPKTLEDAHFRPPRRSRLVLCAAPLGTISLRGQMSTAQRWSDECLTTMRVGYSNCTYGINTGHIHCPRDALGNQYVFFGWILVKFRYDAGSDRGSCCSGRLNEHISDVL